jgi:hypothetical protein
VQSRFECTPYCLSEELVAPAHEDEASEEGVSYGSEEGVLYETEFPLEAGSF